MEGYVKVAAVSPPVHVGNCRANSDNIVKYAKEASEQGAKIIVFPELCVTGYTCGDLFLQDYLRKDAANAVVEIVSRTSDLDSLIVIGFPLEYNSRLYNTACVFFGGKILGFVPKTFIPNYGEFYEMRHFSPAEKENRLIISGGKYVPFGTNQLFKCANISHLQIAIELCEDLWTPIPQSSYHALAGATLILNLSASNETTAKAEYRKTLCAAQSGRCVAGYVYANALDESTTDMVFSGHKLIYENGVKLVEGKPFGEKMIFADIDTNGLFHDRLYLNTFHQNPPDYEIVRFSFEKPVSLLRYKVDPTPFVPKNPEKRRERCEEILDIQSHGLIKRLTHTRANAIIAVSGGLDSTLALLVTVRAFDFLNRDRKEITAITMPCFGTTTRTKSNAKLLSEKLGVTFTEIDITDEVKLHLKSISHDENETTVVYENAQARIRTLVLMNLANKHSSIVIGTGDLSELALGWATYNGDHMSMYGVNAGVPKTLVRHLIKYISDTTPELSEILSDILATPVSPELLPPKNGEISQQTEDIVGPYELHDFFLYHMLRKGRTKPQILEHALFAFSSLYDIPTIKKWLDVFYSRFFSQQFKRSCLPDAPKIGSVSLSPRGDWRMPSDAELL